MLNSADKAFIATLRDEMGGELFRPVSDHYLQEPRGNLVGQAGAVAAPRNVSEVSRIVTLCNKARVGLVPFGGGTGLVGGQVAPDGPAPLVLSLERMNAVRAVYPQENAIVAEAGAILENVQAAAEEAGRLFPLSLASQGTCSIGGNLSTNAGGLNVLRYGNARELCLGLEAVLPSGEVWNGLSRLRKDNTGYDLRHLLIGAEGTLGIITAASLKLFARPRHEATAMMTVSGPDAAVTLLALAQDLVGDGISAFELISGMGYEFLRSTLPDVRRPLAGDPPWSVLIDLGVSADQNPGKALEMLFEEGMERGLVSDGVIASSEAQRAELWAVREQIPEANRRIGAILSTDISVPISRISEMIERGSAAISKLGEVRINAFGHVGDGNLHFNVFPPHGRPREDYAHLKSRIGQVIYDLVHELEGSFSAEHGIGRIKVDTLAHYGAPAKLGAMRAIKAALDPNGIMNPGAVLKGP